jgi:hypothetical protein
MSGKLLFQQVLLERRLGAAIVGADIVHAAAAADLSQVFLSGTLRYAPILMVR